MNRTLLTGLAALAAATAPAFVLAQPGPLQPTPPQPPGSISPGDAPSGPGASDEAPPPPPPGYHHRHEGQDGRDEGGMHMRHGPAHLEKRAYLGISVSPVLPPMASQLKLSEGTGLIVDTVLDDSPAGKAGLKKFDVLQKLDDQILINAEQLAVLVRSHKANDEVKLQLVREGQPTTVSVKLEEKELPSLEPEDGEPPMPGFGHGPHGFPGMMRGGPREHERMTPPPGGPPGPGAPDGPHGFGAPDGPGPDGPRPGGPAPGPGFSEGPGSPPPPAIQGYHVHNSASGHSSSGNQGNCSSVSVLSYVDDSQSITLTDRDGKTSVVVKDKDGKTTFEGPMNTPEEEQKVPADVRTKLQKLRQQQAAPPAAP